MSDLVVTHLNHDGSVISAFSPENLNFTLRKGQDGPHDITYELSRAQAVEDMVGAYRTDFKLQDAATTTPVTIMAGLHTSAPQISSDQERIQIAGKDWLHYLERRYWPYNDSDPNFYRYIAGGGGFSTSEGNPPAGFGYYVEYVFTGFMDSMQIVTDLLDVVLGLPNSLDISYLLSYIGYGPNYFAIDLIDTENILSKIQTLSQEMDKQFDFWIDPDTKEFQVIAPFQYNINVVSDNSYAAWVFDTSQPSTGTFSIDYENVGPRATRLIGQGANQSPTLIAVREYVPGSNQFRLLEDHVSYSGVISHDRVQQLTRKDLLFGLNPIHNVSITVIPESVGDFWNRFHPGKAIWLTADLEAHLIDAAFEIVSIDGTSDLDGNMLATLNLNQIYDPASSPVVDANRISTDTGHSTQTQTKTP